MIQLELKLTLPDALAQEAERAGLLTPRALEEMLREQVRHRRVDDLFAAMNRLANVKLPALIQAEVEIEIAAARQTARSKR
ncbi:MAG: hypothetical protein B6D41_19000 [Chloroflexi bacterium UTCFX4]|jgi:hypothetical protein|nr:MAG: hypothetical protein B6D41_19000 [Chloroflexi bacterium UTCFX4]